MWKDEAYQYLVWMLEEINFCSSLLLGYLIKLVYIFPKLLFTVAGKTSAKLDVTCMLFKTNISIWDSWWDKMIMIPNHYQDNIIVVLKRRMIDISTYINIHEKRKQTISSCWSLYKMC